MAIFSTKKKETSRQSSKQAKKKVVTAKAGVGRARTTMLVGGAAHDIIRAPWMSEKALIATEKGVYAFAVRPRATKAEIASAIKEIYNVEPRMIHIVNLPAKKKALRTRRGIGARSARCKAYVYLNAGDTIQFA